MRYAFFNETYNRVAIYQTCLQSISLLDISRIKVTEKVEDPGLPDDSHTMELSTCFWNVYYSVPENNKILNQIVVTYSKQGWSMHIHVVIFITKNML